MANDTTAEIIVQLPHIDEYTGNVRRTLNTNNEIIINIIAPLDAGKTISGSFTTTDGKTITVVDGVITNIA